MFNFRDLKTAKKVNALILAAVIFLLTIGFVGYSFNDHTVKSLNTIYETDLTAVTNLNEAMIALRSIEGAMYKFVVRPNEYDSIYKGIVEKYKLVFSIIDKYEKGRDLDDFEKKDIEELRKTVTESQEMQSGTYDQFLKAGKTEDAFDYFYKDMRPNKDLGYKLTGDLIKHTKEKIDAEKKKNNEYFTLSRILLISISVLAVVLLLIFSFFITRMIVVPLNKVCLHLDKIANGDLTDNAKVITTKDEIGQLSDSAYKMQNNLSSLITDISRLAKTVSTAGSELTIDTNESAMISKQVAETIVQMAEGTEGQAMSVKETTGIIEKLSNRAEGISTSAQYAFDIANKTSDLTIEGQKAITSAVSQMDIIVNEFITLQASITDLSKGSKEIGEIVSLISSLAEQTNLLALNAAIEAARAGEQGLGFAVVADEVGKLAEQSNGAANKISKLIEQNLGKMDQAVKAANSSNNGVKTGSDIVRFAGKTFQEIANSASGLTDKTKLIYQDIRMISGDIQSIVSSIQNIDNISRTQAAEAENVSAATEEQSASLEKIAEASGNLSNLSKDLIDAIAKFRIS
jgi:methyl-accepting chemotaxis protein